MDEVQSTRNDPKRTLQFRLRAPAPGQPLAIARTAFDESHLETFEGLCAAIQVRIEAGVARLQTILPTSLENRF